jgi:Periplasmic component of the Tol biopolymer transport system
VGGNLRLSAQAVIVFCSPPFAGYQGPGTPFGDPQIFIACNSDPPGEATIYTDFNNFVVADECYNPVLSPDGTKVLFEVLGASSGYREVWVVDAIAGSTPTQLVANGSQYCYHPFWGSDSDTFVYVQGAGGALDEGSVYKDTVSAPGSPTLLKAGGAGVGAFRPQFNFDGTRVAYLWNSSPGELRCMDDDGSNDGLVDTLTVYDANEPPQFCWANTQNLIAYQDGQAAALGYVIDDTGGGRVQINANGVAAGAGCNMSGRAWPADDSFVVFTSNLGSGWKVIRAEIDGSYTTQLGTTGPCALSYMRGALIYQNRIWFISKEQSGGKGEISCMSLTGSGERVVFDSSDGTGDQVAPFAGGDGWYFV